MEASVPKTRAFRIPAPVRVKIQVAERQPMNTKRELELLRRFVWCGGCNALLTSRGDYVYDHFIALELGGKDDASNIRPLCLTCNAIKTALDQKLIAKAKRLAGETGKAPKHRLLPFGRADKYKRTVDGRRVLRTDLSNRREIGTSEVLSVLSPARLGYAKSRHA
jgi:HNH endonuclease